MEDSNLELYNQFCPIILGWYTLGLIVKSFNIHAMSEYYAVSFIWTVG